MKNLLVIIIFLLSSCSKGKLNHNFGDFKINDSPKIPVIINLSVQTNTITAGHNGNTCGIKANNELYCWGRNYDSDDNFQGLLGTNDNTNSFSTTQQFVEADYKAISSGELITCGITSLGKVRCWGPQGNVGDSSYSGGDRRTPMDINDSSTYIAIAAGSYHTCGITDVNELKCWGDSWGDKLGRGGDSADPLISDAGTSYIAISAGRNHTCGITDTNKLKCWGYNTSGQIGQGDTDYPKSPVEVDSSETYKYVHSAENTSCAITMANKLKCWGNNNYGQIGNGSIGGPVLTPELIDGSEDYLSVVVGSFHTCGIISNGTVKCWGRNDVGQLGRGSTSTAEGLPSQVNSSEVFKELTLGYFHSCALNYQGDLYCWGANNQGQYGNSTTDTEHSPTEIEVAFQ